ncbi:hypothetical protein OIU34_13340 [Pararhizobium sp. BT-229]|uniref:hypothetical protein n=1 Tax=Pararhizobium sp. BT-229 TaxID=2986923 RepID=UPI0021F7046C|nr:hypothetical protein [Pararhizobium sp. BT-229]MCV9962888.1 hypothetical protein [Pararhizobium sp. BT-229]
MRSIASLALVACMSATLVAMPIGIDLTDPLNLTASPALAGNGNGGGNGGGHGNGGGNSGHGGGNGRSGADASGHHGKSDTASRHGKSSAKQPSDPISTAFGKLFGTQKVKEKSVATRKTTPAPVKLAAKQEKPGLTAKLAGLNSLNRNYHAYLNSNDPRMAALSAYVVAYAQYELENGTDTVPTDPTLSDDALHDALLSAANKNRVQQLGDDALDQDVMDWAKSVLGVGPSVGKIDQVRETLAAKDTQDADQLATTQ